MTEEKEAPVEETPAEPEEKKEESAEETPAEPEKEEADGDETPASSTMIEDAHKAAERIEAANKETKALLDREESIRVNQEFRGKTKAGKPKEETAKEYKDRVMRGDV